MKMEAFRLTEEQLASQPTTGGYFFTALLDVAEEYGGTDFRQTVSDTAIRDNRLWPDPAALRLIEATYPGAGEVVISRTVETQEAAWAAERQQVEAHYRFGRRFLAGVTKAIGSIFR